MNTADVKATDFMHFTNMYTKDKPRELPVFFSGTDRFLLAGPKYSRTEKA